MSGRLALEGEVDHDSAEDVMAMLLADRLLLVTDGLLETAPIGGGQAFGMEGIVRVAQSTRELSPPTVVRRATREAVVCSERKGPRSRSLPVGRRAHRVAFALENVTQTGWLPDRTYATPQRYPRPEPL